MTLPDFLVIGAEKSGTTWLHAALAQHSQVFLPPTKEIHFFNAEMSNLEERTVFEDRGLAWYERFFERAAPGQVVGEVTPMYLCDEAAPGRIARTVPGVRLIAVLRDPLSRTIAHYEMAVSKGHVDSPLPDLIGRGDRRFVDRGMYGRQLRRYLDHFPSHQLLVLFYEDLFSRPVENGRRVARHLGIDADQLGEIFGREAAVRRNAATSYRSVRLLGWHSSAARRLQATSAGYRVASALKRSGLADAVKRANRRPGSPSGVVVSEVVAVLAPLVADDLAVLSRLTGGPLPSEWTAQ